MAPPKNEKDDDFPLRLPQPGGKEVRFDKEELKRIADRLEKDLKELKSKPHKEAVEELPSDEAVGLYSAGEGFRQSIVAASEQVGGTYKNFIDAYERVIEALRKSKQNLEDADDSSRRQAERTH